MTIETTGNSASAVDPMGRSVPKLTEQVQNHLGTLLASVYAREDEGQIDAAARFADLLAELDTAIGMARSRDDTEVRRLLLAATPALRRFALSLTHEPAAADDLVQETLLRAWKNRTRFVVGTNFEAWTFTIMRNQFYTDRRKSREVQDEDSAHALRLVSLPDQSGRLDLKDLQIALSRLNPLMREALMLVTVEGLSYEDAAAIMNCQLGTVKSRVSRGRDQLAHLLGYDSDEIGSDAVMLSSMVRASK